MILLGMPHLSVALLLCNPLDIVPIYVLSLVMHPPKALCGFFYLLENSKKRPFFGEFPHFFDKFSIDCLKNHLFWTDAVDD